jgi:hypothetical protein
VDYLLSRCSFQGSKTAGLKAAGKSVSVPTLHLAIAFYLACPTTARGQMLKKIRSHW